MEAIYNYFTTYKKIFNKKLFEEHLMKNGLIGFLQFYIQSLLFLFATTIIMLSPALMKIRMDKYILKFIQIFPTFMYSFLIVSIFFSFLLFANFLIIYFVHWIFKALHKNKSFSYYIKAFSISSLYMGVLLANAYFLLMFIICIKY